MAAAAAAMAKVGEMGRTFSMDSVGSGPASPRYPSANVKVLKDRFCLGIAAAKDSSGITRAAFVPNPLLDEYRSFNAFAQSGHLVPFFRSVLSAVGEELQLKDYHLRLYPIMQRGAYDGLQFDGPTEAAAQAAGFFIEIFGDASRSGEPPRMVRHMHCCCCCCSCCCPSPAPTGASTGHVRSEPGGCRAQEAAGLDAPISYTDKEGKSVELSGLTGRDLMVVDGELVRAFIDAQARPVFVAVVNRFVRDMGELTDDELAALWRSAIDVRSTHLGSRARDVCCQAPLPCA